MFQFLQKCCLQGLGERGRRHTLGSLLAEIVGKSRARLPTFDHHTRIELVVEAARRGQVKTLDSVMKAFNFGWSDLHFGHSLLVMVVLFGGDDLVENILSRQPQPKDLTDDLGVNAVLAAVAGGDRPKVLTKLLMMKFSFISKSGKNALTVANRLEAANNCKILLQAGAPTMDISYLGPFWIRNYFVAAGWRREEEFRELVLGSKVPSLQHFCRLAIRKSVNIHEKNLFEQVKHLSLPSKMVTFLIWGQING